MSRTAVIFGGSGFFSTHLARQLAVDPEVSRIILADLREPRYIHSEITSIHRDVRDPSELKVEGEVEIHSFAAVHTTPGHDDWEYYWINMRGAIEVRRFADHAGVCKLFFTSTMGIYEAEEERVDEETMPLPIIAYGKSKLLAEKIHEDWQRGDPQRRLTDMRPAVTFGEGEHGNFERLARPLRINRFVSPVRKGHYQRLCASRRSATLPGLSGKLR